MKKKNVFKKIFKPIYNFLAISTLFKQTDIRKKDVYDMLVLDSRKQILVSTIIILLLQIFYVISDIATDFYSTKSHSWVNLSAEIILIFASLTTLLFTCFYHKNNPLFYRVFYIFYYLLISTGMLLYTFGDFIRSEHINYFSASYFYLIVFAMIPCIYAKDNIIVFTYILVGTIVVNYYASEILIGGFTQYIIVILVFSVIGLYNRNNCIKLRVSRISEEKLRNQLQLQTSIDPLTSALNRRGLQKYLFDNYSNWVKNKVSCFAIMVDIDDFKKYNDTNTHVQGDRCLKMIAQAMMQNCDEKMPHVFRYGGEEFLFFIVGVNETDVIARVKEIKKNIDKLQIKYSSDNLECITVSIGIVSLDYTKMKNVDDFISSADMQMYNAKHQGKNCISFIDKII